MKKLCTYFPCITPGFLDSDVRIAAFSLAIVLLASGHVARAQGTIATFSRSIGQRSYTLAGGDPDQQGTTTISTVLVPIKLSFEKTKAGAKSFAIDAAPDVPRILRSPIFTKFAFKPGGTTQYADAMLRSTFPKAERWHTLLGRPDVKPLTVTVPVGYGYVLRSKKTGPHSALWMSSFCRRNFLSSFRGKTASW